MPALPPGQTYTAVAGGNLHSVALTSAGEVVAWGNGSEGQTTVPAPPAGHVYSAIDAGGFFSAAIATPVVPPVPTGSLGSVELLELSGGQPTDLHSVVAAVSIDP